MAFRFSSAALRLLLTIPPPVIPGVCSSPGRSGSSWSRSSPRNGGNCVLIEVEDTGPGIPRGIRDRLFEPFVTAGKESDLGLGLALSRQTVLDDGGDMWIEPVLGARFVISLPLSRALAAACKGTA